LGQNIKNITIKGNNMQRCAMAGIYVQGTTSYSPSDISIEGNTIYCSAAVQGIRVTSSVSRTEIFGNKITGQGSTVGYGIYNLSPGAMVANNRIYNFSWGIYSGGSDAVINGNLVETLTTGRGMYIAAADNVITGNRVKGCTGAAIQLTSDANDCVLMGNSWHDSTSGLSISTGCTGVVYQTAATDQYNRTT
jgi:hypothetical protein